MPFFSHHKERMAEPWFELMFLKLITIIVIQISRLDGASLEPHWSFDVARYCTGADAPVHILVVKKLSLREGKGKGRACADKCLQ